VPNTSLIAITVSDQNPQQSAAISIAVAEQFRDFITAQAGADNVRVSMVVPARVPTSPYAPRVPLYAIFGATLGVLLAIIAIAIGTYRAISRSSDAVAITTGDGPILGVIPYDRRLRRAQNRLFFLRGINPQADQAIRSVRTKVVQGLEPHDTLRIVVAGAANGDGASTVAANLAIACAQVGTPTVLVDSNLNAPRSHAFYSIENEQGLADLLKDRDLVWTSVAKNVAPNLLVLTAGRTERASIPDVRQVAVVVNEIRVTGGVVVIDVPAVGGHADALAIAQFADRVVVIGSAASAQRGRLHQTVSVVSDAGVRVLGVVLNGGRRKDLNFTSQLESGMIAYGPHHPRVANRVHRSRGTAPV